MSDSTLRGNLDRMSLQSAIGRSPSIAGKDDYLPAIAAQVCKVGIIFLRINKVCLCCGATLIRISSGTEEI